MRLITSRDNPNIRLYKKLVSGKKYRRETGMFPLEGIRLIADAVKENAELHSVFVTESCADRLSKQGEALDFPSTFLISEELAAHMADTDNSQGIFAVCRNVKRPSAADIIKSGGRYILLHRLQDPGNLGTVIRTADAVGLDGVFLAECCELYNPKTVRATMGSLFRVNVSEAALEEVFPLFERLGVPTFAAVVDGDAVSLTDCDFSRGGAVLIGNEGSGLPDEVSGLCGTKMTIKMNGNINSLNAAMAAGIIMWELEARGKKLEARG